MTVQELIQELQQHDPDLTVKIWKYDKYGDSLTDIDNVCLEMNSDETPDHVEILSS